MFKKEKHNIDNFYVGELYLSYSTRGYFSDEISEKQSEEFYKVFSMHKMSVIDFQKGLINKYKDYDLMRRYEGFLTIFYKFGDKYLCLHNNEVYELNGIDFCDNLVSLSSLLPKLSYNIPKEISVSEAIKFFDLLFKNKKGIKLDNTQYSIDDFYIGQLVLHNGYLPYNNYRNRYKYDSLITKHILYNSGSRVGSMYGLEDDYSNLHDFSSLKSLFLRHSEKLYNIQSYQYYDEGVLDKKTMDRETQFGNYYEFMVPFKCSLNESNISYNYETISIPKALKLYRKIDKR